MATGSLAYNLYQGARTEYLAQYVLSAFGSAQMVARTEDYGLDFFCTLGEIVGKMYHIESSYSVQVKSLPKDFSYDGDKSIEWVCSLSTPILYCVINKLEHRIKIYSGFGLTFLSSKRDLSKITINFGEYEGYPIEIDDTKGEAVVHLGTPILDFHISELENRDFTKLAVQILKFWIECDQENLNRRDIGFSLFEYPLNYESNKVPSKKEGQLSGNTLDTFKNESLLDRQITSLYRTLGGQITFASHACDKEYLLSLSTAAIETLKRDQHLDDLDNSNRKNEITTLVAFIKSGYQYLQCELPNFIKDRFAFVEVEVTIVPDTDT